MGLGGKESLNVQALGSRLDAILYGQKIQSKSSDDKLFRNDAENSPQPCSVAVAATKSAQEDFQQRLSWVANV